MIEWCVAGSMCLAQALLVYLRGERSRLPWLYLHLDVSGIKTKKKYHVNPIFPFPTPPPSFFFSPICPRHFQTQICGVQKCEMCFIVTVIILQGQQSDLPSVVVLYFWLVCPPM